MSTKIKWWNGIEWIRCAIFLRDYKFTLLTAQSSHGLTEITKDRLFLLAHATHPRTHRILTDIIDSS